jgi:molecular chaperone GrpE (heat shock protein)
MNELQNLRMGQAGDQRTIEWLTQEIERLKAQQEEVIVLTLDSRLEALFKDLAAPASQVLTQAHLLENQGKAVQAKDILAVSRRMLRVMERNGVRFEGKVGETVNFDPERHVSIQAGQAIQAGQPVSVRFAGVSYRGKVIHKAIVEQETHAGTFRR